MAESERISQTANYLDLFERLLDPSFLVDPESLKILDSNLASERILKTPNEELKGRPITDWVNEKDKEEFLHSIRISKRRYYPRVFDSLWNVENTSTLIMQVSMCFLKLNNESEVIQIIAKDVTKERQAEERIRQLIRDLETANTKLEALSITDEMTKLTNFRHFQSQLKQEHERASRYETPYTIIFCDVDNFKHYNDTNGHPAGDEVLKTVAQILRDTHRTSDISSRYGGEEFVVLCPHTSSKDGEILAERIRKNIESHSFPHGDKQPLGKVSISIGVASFPQDGNDFQEVLKSADKAVYYSKEHGRNQVNVHSKLKKIKGTEKKAA